MTFRPGLRGFVGNLVLLAASVAVGLVALEGGARLLMARAPVITTGEQSVYTLEDPVLGWRNRPGATVRYQRRDYQTEVTINAFGFRDVERPLAKAPGVTRVLALGDSFLEAYTVEIEESITRRAEAIGRAAGCPVEVVNAGVHGYSTDQEALWFVREAEPFKPDIVAVFVYYNDILNNLRDRYWGSPKPVVDVVDGELVPINLPLPEAQRAAEPAGVRLRPRTQVQGSALKALVAERMIMGAPDFYNRMAAVGIWERWEPETVPDELRVYKSRPRLVELDQAWERTELILGALANTIRARGGSPVLVHVPAQFEISERDWKLTTTRFGIDPAAWDRRQVSRRLEALASSGGWAFLDLTPALLRAAGVLGEELYLRYDGHWNRRGHDAAARAFAEFLRDRKLLSCTGG